LDLIDEDPNQPRTADNPGFSPESIAELGATIKTRGVKSPISVRENPNAPGRYLINHGARRFRASKWAGKTTIPAFVDSDYTDDDQVIENLQRDALTAREIAEFIGKKLQGGMKRRAIAAAIGKEPPFVTKYLALLNLPGPLAAAFDSGALKDVNLIYLLYVLYKDAPEDVANWLQFHSADLTRESVRTLREQIEARKAPTKSGVEATGDDADSSGNSTPETDAAPEANLSHEVQAGTATLVAREPHPSSYAAEKKPARGGPVLRVALRSEDRQEGELLLLKQPSAAGRVWVRTDAGEVDAPASDVSILELRLG
jgi:ParB family chromosome partitioning protein